MKNIYIKILEFGKKRFKGFSLQEIIQKLSPLEKWEKEIIQEHLNNAFHNKNFSNVQGFSEISSLFYCIKQGSSDRTNKDNKYILNLKSYFNFIDYLELKEVRETAKEAHKTSIIAIGIATITLVASIIFSIIEICNK